MYAITGATGNTGRVIVEKLLAAGKKVRAIGRNAERLKPLADKGAVAYACAVDDAATLAGALQGATAVYSMIPPDMTTGDYRGFQNRVSEAQAAALRQSGVRHVVTLSSVGAHLSEKVGAINGLHDHEQRLNQLDGVNVLHLRPTYFMENALYVIPIIKAMGVYATPLRGDLPLPQIATRDIAEVAARLLLDLSFTGKATRELLGPREYTMQETARILGAAIGRKDLTYVQAPYEQAEQAMRQAGMNADATGLMIEMYRSSNDGTLRPTEPRSPQNTTPTTMEEFGKTFAKVYNSS